MKFSSPIDYPNALKFASAMLAHAVPKMTFPNRSCGKTLLQGSLYGLADSVDHVESNLLIAILSYTDLLLS